MANNMIIHADYGPLDLRNEFLGRPDIPMLWEILLADKRPVEKRGLMCGEICWPRIEWMHVYERQGRRIAAHQSAAAERRHQSNESPEHKAYKERTVRVAESAGFTVKAEVRAPDGKIQTDVLIDGANGRYGFEIQRSFQSPQKIASRDRLAVDRGLVTAWHTDQRDLSLRNEVAWTRTDNLSPEAIIDGRDLLIRTGLRRLKDYRCDDRSPYVCPTRRTGRCGNWHMRPDVLVLHYDEYVRQVAAGQLVKMPHRQERRTITFWVPVVDRDRYSDALARQPERPAYAETRSPAVATKGSPTCLTRGAEQHGPRLDDAVPQREVVVLTVKRPQIRRVTPHVCDAGLVPCGKPAQLYPAGWRCPDHRPGR